MAVVAFVEIVAVAVLADVVVVVDPVRAAIVLLVLV